jgi:outer membrane scaffolding protein for murein synthesis (MipA/OmpV family)
VDERGQRQYCIPVRLRVGYDKREGREVRGVASRYVIDWMRVEELTKGVVEMQKKGEGASSEG